MGAKPGVKPHVPTPETRAMVKQLTAFGLTQTQVCQFIRRPDGRPVSQDTLARHYRRELQDGLPEANAQVARSLFQQAVAGNITAMIFWLKTRARWSEAPLQLDVPGVGQQRVAGVLMVPAAVSTEAWEQAALAHHADLPIVSGDGPQT